MKILLTVHQFFPEYFSGTEVLTYSVAQDLLRRGHEVYVYTGYPAGHQLPDWKRFDFYDLDGIKVYRFQHAFVPMGDQTVVTKLEYDNHLSASYLAYLVELVQPDLVHFFHFSRLGISLVDVALQYSIPAFYTPTDFWAVCPTSQLLLEDGEICTGPSVHGGNCIQHVAKLTRWRRRAALVKYAPKLLVDSVGFLAKSGALNKFRFHSELAALSARAEFIRSRLNALNGIISPTLLMTDVLKHNGVDQRLIIQSPYGLNIAGFESAQIRSFDGKRCLTFAFIGTLAPHKGCHILLEAFSRLSLDNVNLRIYGKMEDFPDYVSELKNMVVGQSNIEFLGTFPNTEVANILAGVDVLVVPSVWYENTPLVVYSALAAKCPVIASNFQGMAEVVIDGCNGMTFEPRDSLALAQCIQSFIDSPELLERLSANCQKPKSIETYVNQLLEVYSQTEKKSSHTLPNGQKFLPFNVEPMHGYVSGWVVIDKREPTSVRLKLGGNDFGHSSRLYPRPDVLDSLSRGLRTVRGRNFGFALSFPQTVSIAEMILVVEDGECRFHEYPLASLPLGQVSTPNSNVLIAIDQIVCGNTQKECVDE